MDNSNDVIDKLITHLVFILLFNRLHKVNVTELDDGRSGTRKILIACFYAILSRLLAVCFFSRNQATIMKSFRLEEIGN